MGLVTEDELDRLPSTRDQAIEEGEMFYYTGIPCLRGHIAKRYTTSGACYECVRQRQQERAMTYKAARQRRLQKLSSTAESV